MGICGQGPTRPDADSTEAKIPLNKPQPRKDNKNNVKSNNITNSEELSIVYTNADCLTNKLQELKVHISLYTTKPQIISITEVKHKWNYNLSELNIDMFTNEFNQDTRAGMTFRYLAKTISRICGTYSEMYCYQKLKR